MARKLQTRNQRVTAKSRRHGNRQLSGRTSGGLLHKCWTELLLFFRFLLDVFLLLLYFYKLLEWEKCFTFHNDVVHSSIVWECRIHCFIVGRNFCREDVAPVHFSSVDCILMDNKHLTVNCLRPRFSSVGQTGSVLRDVFNILMVRIKAILFQVFRWCGAWEVAVWRKHRLATRAEATMFSKFMRLILSASSKSLSVIRHVYKHRWCNGPRTLTISDVSVSPSLKCTAAFRASLSPFSLLVIFFFAHRLSFTPHSLNAVTWLSGFVM